MVNNNIKDLMMSLWKETFGDSSEYIELIFDSYFNPDLIAFARNEKELFSSLLGIPFDFVSNDNEGVGSSKVLKGLYLCGLNTKSGFRRKGIMTSLLDEINVRAARMGFDFTFLIPANEGLRKFYTDRGYINTFFKFKDYYVKGHKFKFGSRLEFISSDQLNNEDLISFLTEPYHRKLSESIEERQNFIKDFKLRHTSKDWEAVLKDAKLSHEKIYVGREGDKIKVVVFTHDKTESHKEPTLEIRKIINKSGYETEEILANLIDFIHDTNIILWRDLIELAEEPQRRQLWSSFFAKNNGISSEYEDMSQIEHPYDPALSSFPYGMIKIFNTETLLEKLGIIKNPTFSGYSEREILELLLRKTSVREDEESLTSLLGIPNLSFSVSLLLE